MISNPGSALTYGKLMGMQMLTLSQTSCYYFLFQKQLLGVVLSETTIEGCPPIAVVPTHILYFCMSLSLYYTLR